MSQFRCRCKMLGLIVLCMLGNTHAFVPSAALGAFTPGESHVAITKTAIKIIYADLGIATISVSMNKAQQTILDANADIDDTFAKFTDHHCDAENINNCNQVIVSAVNFTIASLVANNVDQARKAFGGGLHTLQDFYSHTNWIELGNTGVHPKMGLSGTISSIAPAINNGNTTDEPTCIDAPAGKSCFKSNLRTGLLTSGYYGGQDRIKPIGKCRHGGFYDSSPGFGGINKDMSSCTGTVRAGIIDAPHNDNHPQAAAAAALATVKLFRELRARVTPRQFKALLGIGVPFAFAIDTTGSMGAVIEGVKGQVASIIDARRNTPEEATQYVLASFNDPFVPAAIVTEDEAKFKAALASLVAIGGGDCPELSMAGLFNAVAAADSGAQVYLFTDASAKDLSLFRSVMSLATSKQSKLFFPLFGACSPYDPVYFTLAKNTGGQVFILHPFEAAQVSRLTDVFSRSDTVDIMSIADVLTSTPKTYMIPVDSHISRLNMSIAKIAAGNIVVKRPDGSVVSSADAGVTRIPLSTATVYSIESPQTGKWSISADGSDQFSILVNGKSDLSFDSFRFVEHRGRPGHSGAFPISGAPMAGKIIFAAATLTGRKQLLSYEFRNRAGTVLSRFSLASNDAADVETQTGEVTVPTEPFNVYAVGEDDKRLNFQRVIATTFNPQSVVVVAPVAVTLPQGQITTYFFKIQNMGAADTFSFMAIDDKKYIRSISTASAILGTGETTIVRVTLDPSVAEPVGTVDTLTFTAQSTSNPDASNFAVLSSPVVAATLAGDVNRDGKIDCDDLGLVRASFGARAGDSAFNPNVDIDNNGVVDARDLGFIARLVSVVTTCK